MSKKKIISLCLLVLSNFVFAAQLPTGFVYLKEIDPTIIQEMRYAGYHNFVGHPLSGYKTATCILTRQAALALREIQTELRQSGLSLKVYDCYRPQTAVNEFTVWSQQADQQKMKEEFYPQINKKDVFKLGYVAEKSGHSRGSTVDLTIVALPTPKQVVYQPGQKLVPCTDSYQKRFHDNSLDMGTGYDCLDELAHGDNKAVNTIAYYHRQMFSAVMKKYGFNSDANEWWHFTLRNEPFSDTYFDFPVMVK